MHLEAWKSAELSIFCVKWTSVWIDQNMHTFRRYFSLIVNSNYSFFFMRKSLHKNLIAIYFTDCHFFLTVDGPCAISSVSPKPISKKKNQKERNTPNQFSWTTKRLGKTMLPDGSAHQIHSFGKLWHNYPDWKILVLDFSWC